MRLSAAFSRDAALSRLSNAPVAPGQKACALSAPAYPLTSFPILPADISRGPLCRLFAVIVP